MTMFSILFPWYVWMCTGIAFLSVMLISLYGLWPFWTVARRRRQTLVLPEDATRPSVSVVVYSRNDEMMLRRYLTTLNEQDYADFETIVVYDSDAETAKHLSDALTEIYPNLRITFMPPGSHNVSRRKLWIMLGMKSAQNDVVVLTAANCEIQSPSWLSDLTAPFAADKEIEISLGICNDDFSEIKGIKKYYARFLRVLACGYWLGYALSKKPFRCDGYNMAIRKELFFKNKGFARTMHLDSGEEDIFLEEVSTKTNTTAVLTPDSILTAKWEGSALRIMHDRRERHYFTERFLRKAPFIRRDTLYIAQWTAWGGAVGAAILALPNLLPLCIIGALMVIMMVLEIVSYRKTAGTIKAPLLSVLVPILYFWMPVGKAIFNLRHATRAYKRFMWQRPPQ